MAHYAKVLQLEEPNKYYVEQVIVADSSFIETQEGQWIQTSYNTKGNVHYGADGQPDGGVALRANYAGVGHTYDSLNDVFYAVSPFPSWVLNTTTWTWEAPTPMPQDGNQYIWDEPTTSWILVTPVEVIGS